MKRIAIMLLPFAAFAVAAHGISGRMFREETIGRLWQESVNSRNNEAATEKLSAFVKAGGDPYLANLRAAFLNYNARKYDEARTLYLTARKLQPKDLNSLLGLFNIARAKGDEAAAAIVGDAILKIEPTNYNALMAVTWQAF